MSAGKGRAMAHPVTPVRVGNVFEDTMEALLQAIRLGQFPPGSKLLPERDLADALHVSRTTLREVLADLGRSGYVTIRRGRYGGAYVSESLPPIDHTTMNELDPDDVLDLLTMRRVIEPAAAALAASRDLDPEQLAALRSLEEACLEADTTHYRPLDSRLHVFIAELSGSSRLRAAVAETRAGVNALLDCIPLLEANLTHSAEQHAAIVDAICAGDPASARSYMEIHVEGTSALLRGFLG